MIVLLSLLYIVALTYRRWRKWNVLFIIIIPLILLTLIAAPSIKWLDLDLDTKNNNSSIMKSNATKIMSLPPPCLEGVVKCWEEFCGSVNFLFLEGGSGSTAAGLGHRLVNANVMIRFPSSL